jgi:hypothetical protein
MEVLAMTEHCSKKIVYAKSCFSQQALKEGLGTILTIEAWRGKMFL